MATEARDQVEQMKEVANSAFKAGKYQDAITFYTQALESPSPTSPLESRRTVIANRAQAYISYGDIHTALRDINLTLSPEYMHKDSSQKLTLKCHYRRAKLMSIMARYEEARADYAAFKRLKGELGVPIESDERVLEQDIERGATAADGSERRRKDELMRAVDARGIILRCNYRDTFPLPPPDMQAALGPDFDPSGITLHFDTSNSRPRRTLSDPNLTAISIPMYIRAPYFRPTPTSTTPYSTRNEEPVSENETVASVLDGLFFSIAGARWPRPQDCTAPTFEDRRIQPRPRDGKIDGVELAMGSFMELYVIPNERLNEFLDKIETGYRECGMP